MLLPTRYIEKFVIDAEGKYSIVHVISRKNLKTQTLKGYNFQNNYLRNFFFFFIVLNSFRNMFQKLFKKSFGSCTVIIVPE